MAHDCESVGHSVARDTYKDCGREEEEVEGQEGCVQKAPVLMCAHARAYMCTHARTHARTHANKERGTQREREREREEHVR